MIVDGIYGLLSFRSNICVTMIKEKNQTSFNKTISKQLLQETGLTIFNFMISKIN